MKLVGKRIDDGNACPPGNLSNLTLRVGTQDDGIHKALEHERRILHGLAAAERRVVITHDKRMRPQTVSADLEARTGTQARLLHNDGDGFAGTWGIVHALFPVRLLLGSRVEHERELLGRQIEQAQTVTSGKGVLAHCATSS